MRVTAFLCLCLCATVAVAWDNNYDGDLSTYCGSGRAVYGMTSKHSNHAEDRLFSLSCANSAVTSSGQSLTGYLNDFDSGFSYDCPSNYAIYRFDSYHSDNKEDRRWAFAYCTLYCGRGNKRSSRDCDLCSPGSYQPYTRFSGSSCTSCEYGKSQQDYGQSSCDWAPTGRYAPYTGMTSPYACQRGKYQDQTGQTSCKPCSTFYYQEYEGQSSCKFSCAWSNKYCFPCTGCTPSSESCQSGFGGARCTTVNVDPAVLSPELILVKEGTSPAQYVYNPIELVPGSDSGTVYLNEASAAAVVGWGHAFQSSGSFVAQSPSTYSDWVASSGVGVVAATLQIDGSASTPSAYDFNGHGVPSPSSPHLSAVVGMHATYSSSGLSPSHDTDRRLRLAVSNGGYIDLRLLTRQDSAARTSARHYLSGRRVDTTVTLHYDFLAPTQAEHSRQLHVNAPGGLSTTRSVEVVFFAWDEPTSYVTHYSLTLCPMKLGVSILTEQQGNDADGQPYCTEPVFTEAPVPHRATTATAPPASITLELPANETLWSLELVVKDAAGNVGRARRLALVDTDPRVDISTKHDILVTSAGDGGRVPSDARELWQTSTNARYEALWADVFSDLRNEHWLKPISRDGVHGLLAPYDHMSDGHSRTGTLHLTGTPNRLGITRFETALACVSCLDDGAPTFAIAPGSELAADTLPPVGLNIEQHLVNGHWYQLHVRATNVFGATANATSIPFGIDVTPPEIAGLGIERAGELELAVHNFNDLQKMSLIFRAFDTESGLRQLEWSLHAHRQLAPGEPEEDALVADASIDVLPVANASACAAHGEEACLCAGFVGHFCYLRDYSFPLKRHLVLADSEADRHGRNFTFYLAVTNRAGLRTETSLNVLVDLTPPDTRGAAVLEGPVDEAAGAAHLAPGAERDVDYIADAEVVVRFRGFVDRESGIHTYAWQVGPECVHEGAVLAEGDAALANFTRRTPGVRGWDTYTASMPGRYVVSAFAYNGAWEPSAVVCSDGATYDPAPAQVEAVRMAHLNTAPGIVLDADGELWAVHANLTRSRVAGPDAACLASAAAPLADAAQWAIYPEAASFGGTADPVEASIACGLPPLTSQLYLGVEDKVNVSWVVASAPGAVHDMAIAVASAPDALEGDYAPFHAVGAARPYALLSDVGLENGNVFFLLLRVTKKSKASVSLAFGPILVASSAPRLSNGFPLSASGSTTVETHTEGFTLRARWPGLAGEGVHYAVGVGRAAGNGWTDDLLPFVPAGAAQAYSACTGNISATSALPANAPCASVPLAQLRGGGSYVVAVRACTGASACVTLTSAPQPAVPQGPPQVGLVHDVGDGDGLGDGADAAAQTTLDTLRFQWRHFDADGATVEYEAGVGSEPGKDDVAQLRPMDGLPLRARWHDASISVELQPGVRYFATVRASNGVGSVVVSSDGVVPLPPGALQVVFDDGTRNCLDTAPNLVAKASAERLELDAAATEASVEVSTALQPGQHYIVRLSTAEDREDGASATGVLELLIGTAHVLVPVGAGSLPARCCCDMAVNNSLSNSTDDSSCPAAAQVGLQANKTCACPLVAQGDEIEGVGDLVVGAWNASSPLDLPFRATGVHVVLSGRFWAGNNTAGRAGLRLVLERLVHCDGHAGAVPLAGNGADATAGAVHAWWHWPTESVDNATLALRAHVTHFEWGLQLRNGTHGNPTWVRDFASAGWAWEAHTPGVVTLPSGIAAAAAEAAADPDLLGPALHVAVRACHAAGCWAPQLSPPRALTTSLVQAAEGGLSLVYVQSFPPGNTTDVELQFNPAAYAVPVVMYQWALEHGGVGGAQLVPWQTVPLHAVALAAAQANASGLAANDVAVVLQRTLLLDLSLYDSAPTFVRLRAFAADGSMGETVARTLAGTSLPPEYHVAVLDVEATTAAALLASTAQGPPTATETAARAVAAGVADIAMTAADSDTLAAAWPELWPTYRADYYTWSVGPVREYINCSQSLVGAEVLTCGETSARAAIASGVAAVEGRTYYFCIKAGPQTPLNARSAIEGGGDAMPRPTATACSNGMTVDRAPPLPGVVAIGHAHADHTAPLGAFAGALHFQRESHSAFVRWHGFSDVEAVALELDGAAGAGPYRSGIAKYTVRLGSAPGLADTFGPVDVGGGTTHLHVANLSLASGRVLVATVDAEDFVGLHTRVVSGPVLVDATAPALRQGAHIHVVQRPVAEEAVDLDASRARKVLLEASWVGFEDAESGVAACSWAVGHAPHRADLAPFVNVGLATFATRVVQLAEGRAFSVTIRCTNRAGLWAEAVTSELVAASAPPVGGHVWDGPTRGEDIDFQTATDVLSASWGGFVDAAGGGHVAHYAWGIGTHPGLTDLVAFRHVGLATTARASGLRLRRGETYYVAVQVCGASGLCTTRASDGVVPDDSPPVAGYVLDGGHAWDLDMQAYAGAITASWPGFHDAHSSIARYTWCVGSAPRQCDLLNATDVGLDTCATTVAVALPGNVSARVYATVTAYNGAGLAVTACSDGVSLDVEPPHVVAMPRFEPVGAHVDASLPAAEHAHQISRSVLRASWAFADSGGRALRYWYTVDTHHEGAAIALDAVGLEDGFVLAGLQLSEGDTYYLRVTVCDEAERCISADGERPLTVDVSPPAAGRLVDAMAWTNSSVRVAWADFVDPHSGVASYEVTVGSAPAAADIVPRRVLDAGATGDGSHGNATLDTIRALVPGELVFITLVAVNPLGLVSLPLHGEGRTMAGFNTSNVEGGVLQLIFHQCESTFCDQQCTCGPFGRCPRSSYGDGAACTQLPTTDSVVVRDGFVVGDDIDTQVEVNVLAASWTGVATGTRVQYMAGTEGRAPGAGIFGLTTHERTTWFEAAAGSNSAILPLPDGTTLANAARFVFYIRVWANTTSYREYASDGVLIDTMAPVATGAPKQDAVTPATLPAGVLLANATDATDTASGNGTAVGVEWTGAFHDTGLGLAYYEWALGRRPGSSDLHPLTRVASDVTHVQVTGLSLAQGEVSFATVRAVDNGGLTVWRSSTALVVDNTPPEAGAVVDGLGPHDEEAQGNAEYLSAAWQGFYDGESSVVAYEVAFGRTGAAGEPDIVPWTLVGLNTTVTFAAALQDGERYAAHVRAYNSLGRRSATVQSDGIVVDLSPPSALPPCAQAANATNLLQDPTFTHDPADVWSTAYAGTPCASGVADESRPETTLRLRHAASLAALPPLAATAATAHLTCTSQSIESNSVSNSDDNSTDATPRNHTFACSTAPELPEDGGRPPVALRCSLSHVANGSTEVVCAWEGDVAAATAEIVAAGAALNSTTNGTLQCAFMNATTGSFVCVEVGGDRVPAAVSVVGVDCQIEHELQESDAANSTSTTAAPPHGRIACVLQRHGRAAAQGVAARLHPVSSGVTDDLGDTPPSEASRLLGAWVSCGTTSPRLQGILRAHVYRAGAAADVAALAISQAAVCPPAQSGQPLPRVRLDWSLEGASPMPLVVDGEVLELRLEASQGEIAVAALRPNSTGCNGVSAAAVPWLMPNSTWVVSAENEQDSVSRPLLETVLARATAAAWAADGGSLAAVADASAGQRAFRLPPWSVLVQTVNTEPRQRYRLRFIAAVEAQYPGARQGGRVTVDDMGEEALPLVVRTFEARHPGFQASETWTQHVIDFEARHVATRIAFAALPWAGAATPLLLAQPALTVCGSGSAGEPDDDTVIDVGAAVQGASDAFVASWSLSDSQSGLEEVMWAIGTSSGGTQLQDFTSTEHTGTATAYGLLLPQNGSVHVTLAARNAAGHVSRFESAAVRIDRTPPEITNLEQPVAVSANGTATVLSVTWTAVDAESNVVWCQVGLSREQDASRDALLAFGAVAATRDAGSNGAWNAQLPVAVVYPLAHGERAVAAVRCGNAAGLLSETRSVRGTLRLRQPPSTAHARVRVARPTGVPAAPFTPVAGAQAETSGLVAFWNGFAGEDEDSDAHVASYEARLLGPGQAGTWTAVGRVREAHFRALVLQDGGVYTVEVRATDVAGLSSAAVAAEVRVLTTAPALARGRLCATWPAGGATTGALLLGWRGAFGAAPCPTAADAAALRALGLDPATCLRYEVSVGRYAAGADVVRNVHTALPELAVPAARLLRVADLTAVDETVAYTVVVTAVNAAGVGRTRHFAVQGAPRC